MNMPDLLSILFVINLMLTLIDASLAYHKTHRLIAFLNPAPEWRETGVKKIRSLLPLMVAFYSGLTCYVFSLRHLGYLGGLTLLLLADIVLQWHIAGRKEKVSS